MSVSLSPLFNGVPVIDANGVPVAGGTIRTFVTDTVNPLVTYAESTGTTANPVQIPIDARGYSDQAIWLTDGLSYRFWVYDADGVPLGDPVDDVYGIASGGGGVTPSGISLWVASGLVPTYVAGSTFTVQGDHTGTFYPLRAVKCIDLGDVTGFVSSSSYNAGTQLTTVIINRDFGTAALTAANLSAVYYGVDTIGAPIEITGVRGVGFLSRCKNLFGNTVVGTPSRFTVTFSSAILNDKDGICLGYYKQGAVGYTLVCDIAVAGVGGYDDSFPAAGPPPLGSTVYLHLIGATDKSLAIIASNNYGFPSFPAGSGYKYSCLIGSFIASAISTFHPMRLVGDTLFYDVNEGGVPMRVLTNGQAIVMTAINLTAVIPPFCMKGIFGSAFQWVSAGSVYNGVNVRANDDASALGQTIHTSWSIGAGLPLMTYSQWERTVGINRIIEYQCAVLPGAGNGFTLDVRGYRMPSGTI